jgi:RNA polymerase sigma-70 factor (ECF subfamily)
MARAVEDILRDLQRGHDNEANFHELFVRFYPQIYRFFLRKGIPPEDCRDLTQDVFFSVYKGIGSIQDQSHFVQWLFTIARNAFTNEVVRRHAQKRSVLQQETGEMDLDQIAREDSPTVLSSILDREKADKLAEALTTLPPQMRRCVQLRVAADSSYEEISVALGISINTVKAHLHKARKSLQEKLGSYFVGIDTSEPERR